jgi:adenosylhomocysteinase
MRAAGHGARVTIIEVDPLRALEAVMDGYQVTTIAEASKYGDLFVTATGDKHVIRGEHMEVMKDGAIICNTGHFNVEIDIPALENMATSHRTVRDFMEEYSLPDGRVLYLLAEGRLVNLSAAEGHPGQVMDMSFANQALAAEFIVNNHNTLEHKVYPVPRDIDEQIAALKLETMGISIDTLTPEQEKYLASWNEGT